jgi:hypothetical protein
LLKKPLRLLTRWLRLLTPLLRLLTLLLRLLTLLLRPPLRLLTLPLRLLNKFRSFSESEMRKGRTWQQVRPFSVLGLRAAVLAVCPQSTWRTNSQ